MSSVATFRVRRLIGLILTPGPRWNEFRKLAGVGSTTCSEVRPIEAMTAISINPDSGGVVAVSEKAAERHSNQAVPKLQKATQGIP